MSLFFIISIKLQTTNGLLDRLFSLIIPWSIQTENPYKERTTDIIYECYMDKYRKVNPTCVQGLILPL